MVQVQAYIQLNCSRCSPRTAAGGILYCSEEKLARVPKHDIYEQYKKRMMLGYRYRLNPLRFGSQDNLLKRISCLALVTYTREDNQMSMSRSSNNVIRRWSSTSAPDNRCHVSEELEHRIGRTETSLNRLGMVLESIQSDVMQVNKEVKEA
ncbi:putative recombination initiation defects 3 [Magnolia sinica]|uniref:putative recombination initiation defects 3 n=1 Tax=Magnolia sinica TaxID=86752 RepID=UPI0026593D01|nr:putative recombination initiation defects 3 [Magnolia sinica]